MLNDGFMTCFHEFRIYGFSILLSQKRHFPTTYFKRIQEKICDKSRGFVDSKFMKTYHEQVNGEIHSKYD